MLRDAIRDGAGNFHNATNRRDLQPDFSAELALADQVLALVDTVAQKIMAGPMPAALTTEVQGAVEKIVIPVATATNATQVNAAKRRRVNATLLLLMASPEFLVQK